MTQVMIYSTSVGCSTSQMNCRRQHGSQCTRRDTKRTDLNTKAGAEKGGKIANALEDLEALI